MSRPFPQINRPNQRDTLLAHLNDHLSMFTTLQGVVGVTLDGGLSRGYGDHLSEIDITIYLDTKAFSIWQHGHAPIGLGIQKIDGALYDIKLVDVSQEDVATWTTDRRWDTSYAKILYDPTGLIAGLFEQNQAYRPSKTDASGTMFAAWWHCKLAGDIWLYREDPLQAHYVLNLAITELIKAIYMANGEFVAHAKWFIHMTRTLPWTPDNWLPRLEDIMCNLAPTVENATLRQHRIAELWEEVDDYIVTDKDYPLSSMHHTFYQLMVMLVENESIPVERWQALSDLSVLNQAPFNRCVSIHEDAISLDRGAFLALTPDDMYGWYYDIVDAVRYKAR